MDWSEAAPWFIGTLGSVCLALIVGFLVGVHWGVAFATAREVRDEQNRQEKAAPALLTPEYWSPQRIAAAAGAPPVRVPDAPNSYRGPSNGPVARIPGLDDGD